MAVGPDGKIVKPHKKASLKKDKLSTTDLERYIEIEQHGAETPSTDNKPAKAKLQGIVIDGKTYTCATCKSGHRVGVCKHATERPMKPTHPPGRPAAGAPKKVVCDCPKECSCSKRDCKCPRTCLCTQTMFMLVYIPGPGEPRHQSTASIEEEMGEWRIKEEVITDLKGNILRPEEAEERQRQKEAQRDGESTPGSIRSRSSSMAKDPSSPSQAKPKASGGCCKHKQAVARERRNIIQPETKIQISLTQSASIHGCNCGAACACAFCPQHPNNQTSQDLARQQATFISQQRIPLDANFLQFNPNVPQEMSCMGGQPRFAVSRQPVHRTIANFQEAFPAGGHGGYIIAYPMQSRCTPVPHLHEPDPLSTELPLITPDIVQTQTIQPMDNMSTQMAHTANYDWCQDFFDVGDAMVANDGPNGWEQHFLQDNGQWALPSLPSESKFDIASPVGDDVEYAPFNNSTPLHFSNNFSFSEQPQTLLPSLPINNAHPSHGRAYSTSQQPILRPNIEIPMTTGTSFSAPHSLPNTNNLEFAGEGFFDPSQLLNQSNDTQQPYTNLL